MGLIIAIIVLYIGCKLVKRVFTRKHRKLKKQSRTSMDYSSIAGLSVKINRRGFLDDNAESDQISKVNWYDKNRKVSIKGYSITDGMVYVGRGNAEASLLDGKLPVSVAEPDEGGDEMSYWPTYSGLSDSCRGAYLKWLSTGRQHPNAYIGYVFLFFYGLERRLFKDGLTVGISDEERNEIVLEVRRLLSIYGSNGSFNGYASRFLATEWAVFRRNEGTADHLDFSTHSALDAFRVILAKQVSSEKPLSAEIILTWLLYNKEFLSGTVHRRCKEEFSLLFTERYHKAFGNGIVVKPNKTKLKITYHPASPSLLGNLREIAIQDLPDPFALTAPLKKVIPLAEQCSEELQAYSRTKAKNTNSTYQALASLPKEIIAKNEKLIFLQQLLEYSIQHKNGLISIYEILSALNHQKQTSMNKKDSELLVQLIEKLGYGVAPDIRIHGINPDIDGNVAVFSHGHGIDFSPSNEFCYMCFVLRLGSMISQSDGTVCENERKMLSDFIAGNQKISIIEKNSLNAFLNWSLQSPQNLNGPKQRIAGFDDAAKITVRNTLIAVTHADGLIDPRELKQLEKLYTALGLNKTDVISDIHSYGDVCPITVAEKEHSITYSIPKE